MSRFTEQHENGVRAFTERLEHKQKTCSSCEFEDSVLHSEWKTHVETTPKPCHIRYELTCPDCDSTEIVEIDI